MLEMILGILTIYLVLGIFGTFLMFAFFKVARNSDEQTKKFTRSIIIDEGEK